MRFCEAYHVEYFKFIFKHRVFFNLSRRNQNHFDASDVLSTQFRCEGQA